MKEDSHNKMVDHLESVLTQNFAPIKPREEFIGKLRHQLEEEILPIQSKKTIGFKDLFQTLLTSIIVVLSVILLFRSLLIIISSIVLWQKRKSKLGDIL